MAFSLRLESIFVDFWILDSIDIASKLLKEPLAADSLLFFGDAQRQAVAHKTGQKDDPGSVQGI